MKNKFLFFLLFSIFQSSIFAQFRTSRDILPGQTGVGDFYKQAVLLQSADFDNDGDLDLISGHYISDKIFVYRNGGGRSGFGTSNLISRTNGGTASPTDVDDDGRIDVVSAWQKRVFMMRNLGGFRFSDEENIMTMPFDLFRGGGIRFADMDGDGDEDMIAQRDSDKSLFWFEKTGARQYTTQHTLYNHTDAPDYSGHVMEILDYDGDGDLDVVSLDAYNGINLFENLGSGVFSGEKKRLLTEYCLDDWEFIDFDGDGDQDIVATFCDIQGKNIRLYRNNGNDQFSSFGDLGSEKLAVGELDVFDIDKDGFDDIICGGKWGATVLFYKNQNNSGVFDEGTMVFDDGSDCFNLLRMDVDDNDDPDYVINNYGTGKVTVINDLGVGSDKLVVDFLDYRCNDNGTGEIINDDFLEAKIVVNYDDYPDGFYFMNLLPGGQSFRGDYGDTLRFSLEAGSAGDGNRIASIIDFADLADTFLYKSFKLIDPGTCSEPIAPQDFVALMSLYENTDGEKWLEQAGFEAAGAKLRQGIPLGVIAASTNHCNWYGVTCSGGRVTKLDLTHNNLIGVIPEEIGLLTELQELKMHGDQNFWNEKNSISGPIPEEFGNLAKLKKLELYRNRLTSVPPSFGNLTQLESVDMSINQIKGLFFEYLENLKSLQTLRVEGNDISGTLPDFIGDLSLRHFRAWGNQISGTLPESLGEMGKKAGTVTLLLNSNQFTGCVPDSYESFCDGDIFDINGNPGLFNKNRFCSEGYKSCSWDGDNDGFPMSEDCDDDNPNINPDADEIPGNLIDENCDGDLETDLTTIDQDMDGSSYDEDCDDLDPNINPNLPEIPNNDIDENCDGIVLIIDDDNDGFNSDEDCDDNDPTIYPDANEIINNDIDEDCDGFIAYDLDNDGYIWMDDDCDDTNPDIYLGANEIPNNDVDEDCDGIAQIIDVDMDGYNSDEDCDDNNLYVNPGASEIPNNDVDEDCDGTIAIIDNDFDGFNSDEDCNDENAEIFPGALEIPNNGIDEDCDGEDLIVNSTNSVFENQIKVFPNPVRDELFIQCDCSQNIDYQLVNSFGQVASMGNFSFYKNDFSIKTDNLSSGVFSIILKDKKTGNVAMKRFLKIE